MSGTGSLIERYRLFLSNPYARLMRLDKPIGTWLLLLPCWWSVALAAPKLPDLWLMFLFAVGAVVMRGAGCVVNDIYDRNFDRQVERTSTRPLANGEIKLWQAILFLAILLAAGLGILVLFNGITISIGLLSLFFVFTYPLMKRITWWPQLFLGFTFNWGALMGWSAVNGSLGLPALLLYVAGIFWTLGYDTVYAHQDKHDDEIVGIKSTALLLGDRSRPWVTLFYAVSLGLFAFCGWSAGLKEGFYAFPVLAAAFILLQLALWKIDDPKDCFWRFCSNRNFGLILLLGIVVGKYI